MAIQLFNPSQISLLHSSSTLRSTPFLGSSCTASAAGRLRAAALGNNLYKVLSIAETASPEEIKTAYRRQARKWHPDVCPSSAEKSFYADQFMKLKLAYEVLSDLLLRAKYDLTLKSAQPSSSGVELKGWGGLGDWVTQVERLKQQTAIQCGFGAWEAQLEGLQQLSASRARRRYLEEQEEGVDVKN